MLPFLLQNGVPKNGVPQIGVTEFGGLKSVLRNRCSCFSPETRSEFRVLRFGVMKFGVPSPSRNGVPKFGDSKTVFPKIGVSVSS